MRLLVGLKPHAPSARIPRKRSLNGAPGRDELGEPPNSRATHLRLIESGAKVGQTPFMTGRERDEAPDKKGEILMKKKMTLALAALIFSITLTAFPHVAAADTGTTPQASSEMTRPTGKSPMVYMRVILAVGNLLSALLP